MRRIVLAPIAILSTSCAMRPWTPSVSVAYWSQDVPDSTPTPLPMPADAMARWQLPEGNPWARFSKLTLLASLDGTTTVADLPDVRRLDVVHSAESAASTVAAGGLPEDTLWLVDLRGAASVAFASALGRLAREPVAPILTFNNWPAENALIPAEETLAALITHYPKLPPPGPSRPVILLDAWRLAFRFDQPSDDVVDNRYAVAPHDLPDESTLRAAGVRRVIYLVEDLDDTESEEDDIHEVALAWQRAGIELYMVDLAWLADQRPSRPWHDPAALSPRALVVRERVTILSNPVFYGRARGGFGGVFIGVSPRRGSTFFGGRGGG
jgi:hypothetical protein